MGLILVINIMLREKILNPPSNCFQSFYYPPCYLTPEQEKIYKEKRNNNNFSEISVNQLFDYTNNVILICTDEFLDFIDGLSKRLGGILFDGDKLNISLGFESFHSVVYLYRLYLNFPEGLFYLKESKVTICGFEDALSTIPLGYITIYKDGYLGRNLICLLSDYKFYGYGDKYGFISFDEFSALNNLKSEKAMFI